MKDFIAEDDCVVLQRSGLADFEALWALDLPAVDNLNQGRGGWSGVSRLEVDGQSYYLKRQCNYLVRSVRKPFGEPTFGREFRNILLYHLGEWLANWQDLKTQTRDAILEACGSMVNRLHEEGLKHGCLYPKHIFLRPNGRCFDACLIDLEKTRPMLFDRRGRVRDIEALVRRAGAWREQDVRALMSAYLRCSADDVALAPWMSRLSARSLNKAARA